MNVKIIFLALTCTFLSTSTVWCQDKTTTPANRQAEMMKILMKQPKYPVKKIGILLYDGFNLLDAMAPYHTLSELMNVKVFFVAKTKGTVKNQSGLKLQVDSTIAEVQHLDILVIPGGGLETFKASLDTAIINWIQKIDKTSLYTTSVCTGAWILGGAGLLQGKNATTNWYRAEEMMSYYGAQYKKERWVRDGKYWTSAGVTAGMDMSLAIIYELMGKEYTQGVMLDLEYDPKPPIEGGTPDKSEVIVADMMKEMYDMGMLPVIQKERKANPAKFKKTN